MNYKWLWLNESVHQVATVLTRPRMPLKLRLSMQPLTLKSPTAIQNEESESGRNKSSRTRDNATSSSRGGSARERDIV